MQLAAACPCVLIVSGDRLLCVAGVACVRVCRVLRGVQWLPTAATSVLLRQVRPCKRAWIRPQSPYQRRQRPSLQRRISALTSLRPRQRSARWSALPGVEVASTRASLAERKWPGERSCTGWRDWLLAPPRRASEHALLLRRRQRQQTGPARTGRGTLDLRSD